VTDFPVFLGIDVGTTTVKAALVDLDGRVVATASKEYPTHFLHPGWVEQNPEDWWKAALIVIGRVRHEIGSARFAHVAGLAVSSQAPTLLALDGTGAPLRHALIWMDRRADAQAKELTTGYAAGEYLAAYGNRPDAFYVAPKMLWLRRSEPAVFDRARSFVQINGYLVLRLTGELTLDDQHASLHALRAPGASEWSDRALVEVGIDPSQLPSVDHATRVVGQVTAAAAAETGLPVGTPVVTGTVDSAAAAIEVGSNLPGLGAEMTGTSTVIVMPSEKPVVHEAFISMSSPVADHWFSLAAMVASGASLRWLKQIAVPDEDYTAITARAADSTAGAGGVLFVPHLMGERSPLWDSSARGSFSGISLSTGVADLARSVLEGTAFALRHNLELAAEAGLRQSELRSTGAPTLSDLWCQIKADVTGVPIARMVAPTGATFGDAMLAAVGTGAIAAFEDFGHGRRRLDPEFTPDPTVASLYDELFHAYLETIAGLHAAQRSAQHALETNQRGPRP